MRILIVDDDVELTQLLCDYLGQQGFAPDVAHDGPSGLSRARAGEYRAVVLDIMLPGMDGLDVLRALRPGSRVPVLMLTARGEEVDRVVGLELGADDYLPKPFSARELAARLRALVRRAEQHADEARAMPVSVGDVTLDGAARTARRGATLLTLTSVEFALLEQLLRGAGTVVARETLCEAVLGRRFSPYDRSLDVHVSNLRKKLGPAKGGGERIQTVRGTGYIYREDGS
jgi:two-component system, OmpR family, response regulator CpxR